jgi:methionyl-tRNA synthetase
MSEQRRRYLVTSALPYANGPLHVGQISGAYLPADAFVRYLRARGEDVVYACGTDEHGVPITLTTSRAPRPRSTQRIPSSSTAS